MLLSNLNGRVLKQEGITFLSKWANTLCIRKPKCFPAHQREDAQLNLHLSFESAPDKCGPPYGLAQAQEMGCLCLGPPTIQLLDNRGIGRVSTNVRELHREIHGTAQGTVASLSSSSSLSRRRLSGGERSSMRAPRWRRAVVGESEI